MLGPGGCGALRSPRLVNCSRHRRRSSGEASATQDQRLLSSCPIAAGAWSAQPAAPHEDVMNIATDRIDGSRLQSEPPLPGSAELAPDTTLKRVITASSVGT